MSKQNQLHLKYTRSQKMFITRLKREFKLPYNLAVLLLIEFAIRRGFGLHLGYTEHTTKLYELANTNLSGSTSIKSSLSAELLAKLNEMRGAATMSVFVRGMVQFAIDSSKQKNGSHCLKTDNGSLWLDGGEKCK